jgi:hypothetical protein
LENNSYGEGGDNLVRHPCDSKAWRHFHKNVDLDFGRDPRNAHFALATDGVNPFKQNRSTWSTWHVLLLNYNLPSWLSTKKFFVILTLLIPGKQSVTSEVFDVYLQPLVEEFLQLWTRIPAYDVSKDLGCRAFNLRAMLLWTIHDFPEYATVGGFAHQGYVGCSWCGSELGAEYFVELGKQTYRGTRCWLPEHHAYRLDEMQVHFTRARKTCRKPRRVSVEEQLEYVAQYETWRAAGNRDGGTGDPSKVHGCKRTSILYTLPYWKVSSDLSMRLHSTIHVFDLAFHEFVERGQYDYS